MSTLQLKPNGWPMSAKGLLNFNVDSQVWAWAGAQTSTPQLNSPLAQAP